MVDVVAYLLIKRRRRRSKKTHFLWIENDARGAELGAPSTVGLLFTAAFRPEALTWFHVGEREKRRKTRLFFFLLLHSRRRKSVGGTRRVAFCLMVIGTAVCATSCVQPVTQSGCSVLSLSPQPLTQSVVLVYWRVSQTRWLPRHLPSWVPYYFSGGTSALTEWLIDCDTVSLRFIFL